MYATITCVIAQSMLGAWSWMITALLNKHRGERVMGDVLKYGRESEENIPKLTQYNAYGRYCVCATLAPYYHYYHHQPYLSYTDTRPSCVVCVCVCVCMCI